MSAFGTKQTFEPRCSMSAFGGKADILSSMDTWGQSTVNCRYRTLSSDAGSVKKTSSKRGPRLAETEMISTHPHERFSAVLSLNPSNTSEFARWVGDANPLHHDMDYAAATRFGRLLASGPQTTAHLLALTASHFSKRGAMLALNFGFGFSVRYTPTKRSRSNGLSYL